jgi:hypothetical protein
VSAYTTVVRGLVGETFGSPLVFTSNNQTVAYSTITDIEAAGGWARRVMMMRLRMMMGLGW